MKTCVIITNASKPESQAIGGQVARFLTERGIATAFYTYDGSDDGQLIAPSDFVVTLGGDGTVLFAARNCAPRGIPVFPINLGDFGFIASIEKDDWQQPLERFLRNELAVSERSMVSLSVTGSTQFSAVALNDVTLCASTAVTTVALDVTYNDVPLGVFKADGIIVCTATGSTAYSASAGGPIVDPDMDALVLTPVNAFSLSSRPLVMHPSGELGITMLHSYAHTGIVTVDGQRPSVVNEGDHISIRRALTRVKLAGCTPEKFYRALRSKLNWAGGPHARKPFD
ncbi:MAG: NAD(+)/NADH kinase [Treponema sp.]|nr:NAD(+)/NADH kinase [Treponema sp.]